MARNHTVGHSQPQPKKIGPAGPPKNSVTMIADIVMTFMNSAKKNSAKRMEEYSVWKPPTSSCSASTKSNGGRFSSAVAAIRNTRNGTTPLVTTNHVSTPPAWAATMRCVESVPAPMTTATTAMPSAAS